MKLILFLLISAVAYVAPARAQPMDRWLLPDPDEMVKASNALCVDQAKSALLAWQYRTAGKSKAEVLALLPESPKAMPLRLVGAMRENVEDTFTFPDISQYTLYFFRSEVCLRETLGAVRMPRLQTVVIPIRECQRIHGETKSVALSKCIQGVVRAVEP